MKGNQSVKGLGVGFRPKTLRNEVGEIKMEKLLSLMEEKTKDRAFKGPPFPSLEICQGQALSYPIL